VNGLDRQLPGVVKALLWYWVALVGFAIAVMVVGCISHKHGLAKASRSLGSEARPRVCVIAQVGHGARSAWDTRNQKEIQCWLVVQSSTDLVHWAEISRTKGSAILYRSNEFEFFRGMEVWE
jgi:hypothetical protein